MADVPTEPNEEALQWVRRNEVFITLTLTVGGAVGGGVVYLIQKGFSNQQELGRIKFMDVVSHAVSANLEPKFRQLDDKIGKLREDHEAQQHRICQMCDSYAELNGQFHSLAAVRQDFSDMLDIQLARSDARWQASMGGGRVSDPRLISDEERE